MKHKISAIITIAASMLFSAAALPVQAAEVLAGDIYVGSVCPDFVPLSDDQIIFWGLPYNQTHITIVQHSPERENLVLYDTMIQSDDKNNRYIFAAEPGNYTVTISTPTVYGCHAVSTFTEELVIENPDFATGIKFERTDVRYDCYYERTADDKETEPRRVSIIDSYNYGTKCASTELLFPRYEQIRGDFNDDQVIDIIDAQLTLNHYTEVLAGNPSELTPAAAAACDIDGNNALDSADAQNILLFYTDDIAGNIPYWPDGTTDGAHDPAFADRTMYRK